MEMWNYLYYENTVLKQILISQVIPEILLMKTRIEAFERYEINKNSALDIIVSDLINQKINVQNKLNEVDKSIIHINVKLREAKEPHKVEVKKADAKTNDKICKFNRFGFCRERQSCLYFHAMKVCEDFFNSGVCTQQSCRERHPRRCTYFDSGECQWGSQCKYLHKGRNNEEREDED